MLLSKLATYAHQRSLAAEPGFAPKTARWAIWLNSEGSFVDLLDLRSPEGDRLFPQSPDLQQNELIAGGVTRSHFLLDTTAVVALFGVEKLNEGDRRKILAKHEYFIELLEKAARDYSLLEVCSGFLKEEENLQQVRERLATAKAKPTDKVTFRVGAEFAVDSANWHDWWREFRAGFGTAPPGENRNLMRCFQTGELAEPLKTHPKVKGLSAVGGQPSGCVLIGFDKEAFTSYGLQQSCNAAVSEEAATVYVNALNDLVRKADRPIAGTMLIYWFREAVTAEEDPLNWIKGIIGGPEGEELDAIHRARELVEGISLGRRPDLAGNTYYAAIISAAGGRVMVRDWMEGNFEELARNAELWFEDLTICTRDGSRRAKDPGLYGILYSLVRKELDELRPSLAAEMWQTALFGRPFPPIVLSTALQRIRAEMVDSEKTPNHARMGLIKAYHVRKARLYGGEHDLSPFLNEKHPSAAYQAGRLMSALAAIQRSALGDVGASVVQRYYAAASSTPALVLGRLIRQSQFHLNKLDKGLAIWYEHLIAEITGQLGDGLPKTLDLEGQSLFALGYYQQMAAIYSRKQDGKTNEGGNGK